MTESGASLLERLLPQRTDSATQARSWLAANGLPSAKDEWWKYTALDDILGVEFAPASTAPEQMPDRMTLDSLAGALDGPRLVFVDGAFAEALSDLSPMPAGVHCAHQSASELPARHAHVVRYDGFQALNDAAGNDGAVIRVAAGSKPEQAVTVVHLSTGRDTPVATHPRTSVEIESDAEVTLVEIFAGTPGQHLTNAATTINVGPGASLTHYKLLRGPERSTHVAHTRIIQAAHSMVRSWSLLAGAERVRNAVDIAFRGADSSVDLQGLYLPFGTQRHDTAVTVEHAASRCKSRQIYKGVIDDKARGSFSGRVIVESDTTGTDADQTSRSLLLAPTAQADTRPWLEIFAEDVRCTHGAAVGRLDDEALFYLRTRGIPEPEARQILVGAFIEELAGAVTVPSLRAVVAETVADAAGAGR